MVSQPVNVIYASWSCVQAVGIRKLCDSNKWRVKKIHEIIDGTIQTPKKDMGLPPFHLTIRAEVPILCYIVYIHSVLNGDKIQKLFEWAKDTYSPFEFVWATIQRINGVPGSSRISYKHDLSEVSAFAQLVKWQDQEGPPDSYGAVYPECHGIHVRAVCVYGVGDLQHHLFANKFDTDSDSIVIYCLEKYLRQKALDGKIYKPNATFDSMPMSSNNNMCL